MLRGKPARRGRVTVVAALALLALVACSVPSGDDETRPSASASEEPTGADVDPQTAVASRELTGLPAAVTAEVLPVVRDEGQAVLTIDLDAGGEELRLDNHFGASASPVLRPPQAIRLFDPESGEIMLPAHDGEEIAANQGWYRVRPEGTRLQLVFAAPEHDAVAVLLPGAGLVPGIPVIDAEPPEAPQYDALGEVVGDKPFVPETAEHLPVVAVGSYAREHGGSVAALDDGDLFEVTLESDVLFGNQSADLEAGTEEILERAAELVTSREAETVYVVGHTDDHGTEEYNQELSEQRAEAVAEALAERIDTTTHPIETEGRAFDEPVAPNSSEAGRARNRRVSITLEAPQQDPAGVRSAGELPDFEDGPTAPGPDGVEVLSSQESWRVTASSAEPLGRFLTVDLELTNTGDEDASVSLLSGVWSHRGTGSGTRYPSWGASGVSVLSGESQIFPVDYQYGTVGDTELWATVSDIDTRGPVAPGGSRVVSVVFPALEDASQLTLQVDSSLGTLPFRLTDIPVDDAG